MVFTREYELFPQIIKSVAGLPLIFPASVEGVVEGVCHNFISLIGLTEQGTNSLTL